MAEEIKKESADPSPDQGRWNSYVWTALALAVATAARAALTPLWGSGYTFITFYPAIMVSASLGGWRFGLSATFASAILSCAIFLPLNQLRLQQGVALGVFVGANVFVTFLVDRFRRRRAEAETRVVDLTTRNEERRQAEEKLRESEERFRAMADNIAPLAWMANADGWIFFYNKRWYDYTGTTLEEMQGWGWDKVHHPDHLHRVARKWRAQLEKGEVWEDTFPLRGKDGEYRWFLSRAFPIRDAQGKILRWFGTNTDIDDQKRAEENLEKTVNERTAKLRETIEQLEEFSYSVAHDLRAPLRAMQGYANALLSDYGDQIGETGKDYLQRISKAGLRMDRLTSDTLTYSKVARVSMPRKTVSLDKLVPEITQHYPQIEAAQAEITVASPLLPVLGNEIWLTQVISNLLGNAVKFVAQGTKPQIRIRTESRDGQVRLWVEDNGIGIKPEHQSRLFGMFERLHPNNNQYEGTGIGLAIVRKSIERMGGTVGVESDGQTGSQFWIQLPAPQEIS